MRPKPIKANLTLYFALLVLALAAMWFVNPRRQNAGAVSPNFVKPGGDTLTVAIELAPTIYSFSGDSIVGFDYEMIRDIAQTHGINVVFYPFAPVDYALNGLKKGDFDMIVASVPSSAELNADFLFTDDVFTDRQVLIRQHTENEDKTVPLLIELLNDTVWIPDASPYKNRIRSLIQELGDTIFVMTDRAYTSEHLVTLVALGEIRQAIVNESVAKKLKEEYYPQLDLETQVTMQQFQPWILSKDKPELRDSVNAWIGQYKKLPKYAQLIKKYF